jgi:hypothetical protein
VTDGTSERMRYLVELAAPEAGWTDIERMMRQARSAAPGTGATRLIRSIFVPEDGRCFLLYEAESAQEARLAAVRAELEVAGVAETLHAEER